MDFVNLLKTAVGLLEAAITAKCDAEANVSRIRQTKAADAYMKYKRAITHLLDVLAVHNDPFIMTQLELAFIEAEEMRRLATTELPADNTGLGNLERRFRSGLSTAPEPGLAPARSPPARSPPAGLAPARSPPEPGLAPAPALSEKGFKIGDSVVCALHKNLPEENANFVITNIQQTPNGSIILIGMNNDKQLVSYAEKYCENSTTPAGPPPPGPPPGPPPPTGPPLQPENFPEVPWGKHMPVVPTTKIPSGPIAIKFFELLKKIKAEKLDGNPLRVFWNFLNTLINEMNDTFARDGLIKDKDRFIQMTKMNPSDTPEQRNTKYNKGIEFMMNILNKFESIKRFFKNVRGEPMIDADLIRIFNDIVSGSTTALEKRQKLHLYGNWSQRGGTRKTLRRKNHRNKTRKLIT
jgi:hypothetical protein